MARAMRVLLSAVAATCVSVLGVRTAAAQEVACCSTWETANAASCILLNGPCPSNAPIPVSIVVDDAGPATSTDACVVYAIPSCCMQSCAGDPVRCAVGDASAPVWSCCSGFCGEVTGPAFNANQCSGAPISATCTASAVELPALAQTESNEWVVNFGTVPISDADAGYTGPVAYSTAPCSVSSNGGGPGVPAAVTLGSAAAACVWTRRRRHRR